MILVKTKYLNLGGIALFPFVIINSKLTEDRIKTLINHERIHIRQQLELLVLPFYIWYLLNYFYNRMKFKTHNEAYRNIIFEREAFDNESKFEYLSERKVWAFLKYAGG